MSVSFTMTIEDEEWDRKQAIEPCTHHHIYLLGLAAAEKEKARNDKKQAKKTNA